MDWIAALAFCASTSLAVLGEELPKTVALSTKKPANLFSEDEKSFWAFQPVRDVRFPEVKNTQWVQSPIDRFVLSQLESNGLKPAAPATRQKLIRRVTFDLTGLPPTPVEIKAFNNDVSADAFPKLVNRLLASKHYGERWGKHWLDIARYGESAAHDGNNAYLHAWRYRDYVIQAFNEDKPYDQFIIEQLAGDLLPKTGDNGTDYNQMVATGFLQIGPKPVVMRDKRQMLLDIADEQLHTTGIAFMALTLGCARCHDHKFDPIPTKDYYSLAGFFMNTHVMFDQLPDSMWLQPQVKNPKGRDVKVMAVQDLPKPKDLKVHLRGSYRTLGNVAPRRFLQIIAGEDHTPLQTEGSGRLELARWIASPKHPLTARVMVNRIWQKHFGRGLVASSDDFGARGDKPTHPELLDWLAWLFVKSGWSIKEMHRLMVLSSTYQQSSDVDAQAAKVDPSNKLLWHMPRRRLDAEEIRDAILTGTGQLDTTVGGNLFTSGYKFNDSKRDLPVVEHIDVDSFGPFQEPRRSVYMPAVRNVIHPMLRLFDTANEHESSPTRHQTTVAPQALFMMNSPFVRRQAAGLIFKLFEEKQSSFEDRLSTAYLVLLGRPPTIREQSKAKIYITKFIEQLGGPEPPDRKEVADAKKEEKPTPAYTKLIGNTHGLVAYYRFNELYPDQPGQKKAPRIANTVKPNPSPGEAPNNATFGVAGPIIAKGSTNEVNRGIRFNGTDQFVRISDPAVANVKTGSLTVEYWINPAEVRLGFGIGRDGPEKRYWKSGIILRLVDGEMKNVVFHEYFGGAGGFRTGRNEFSVAEIGLWTHVVFTFGNGYRQLYVNGRQVDELSVGVSLPTGDLPITFGARLLTNSEYLKGSLDEVAFYDRVLEVNEIEDHYLAGGGEMHKRESKRKILTHEKQAWLSYCQALMCMNEFVYVD